MESILNEITYWIEVFQQLIFAKHFFVCCVLIWLHLKIKKKEKHNIYDMPPSVSAPGVQTRSKLINYCYSEINCTSGPWT